MPQREQRVSVPDVDPDEEVGAAPVRPEDGKDPYPPDVLFYQDHDDDGLG